MSGLRAMTRICALNRTKCHISVRAASNRVAAPSATCLCSFTRLHTVSPVPDAWWYGKNSTALLDSLMTENIEMQTVIGLGNDKPKMYDSDFEGVYNEMRKNYLAMKEYCDKEITFKFVDTTNWVKTDESS